MADNYLERRMEDYRSGKRTVYSTGRKQKSNTLRDDEIAVRFPQQNVFVTGGAGGIGQAIVKRFREAGCKVAFCDIDSSKGNATAQATGALFIPCDVTDTEALQRCMDMVADRWGRIDILINNVGISEFKPLAECTQEDFMQVLNTNLLPVFITSRKLLLQRTPMPEEERMGGRIINICSTRARMSERGTQGYSASKGGILALTHSLMMDFADLGITVNSISPGWINTDSNNTITDTDNSFHPSGRVGLPQDIAGLCLFLASPDAAFINGENITADGGVSRKMIYP